MKNKVEDLRNHLFEEIEKLKESAAPEDIERAKTISTLSARIIETAKAETDYLRAVSDIDGGARAGSGFIPCEPRKPAIGHDEPGHA